MKTIVLLLDGTWNNSAFGDTDTNIVRLRELIAKKLASQAVKNIASPASSASPSVSRAALPISAIASAASVASLASSVPAISTAAPATVVFYERGVGTGAFLNRWTGGAFGEGLTTGIRRAYRFLSFHYELGDRVFVFGFSRGAYTARSLVGYVQSAGLLLREHCTDDLEHMAWDYYRCVPDDRLPGVWTELTTKVHDRDALQIRCLGVFDTVGALGVPLAPFKVSNRDRYEFHDVDLSAIVSVNLQAIALDEHREPFEASVWRKNKFKTFKSITEQVWFAGAHADVGGGYLDEDSRVRDRVPGLDDVSLDWMLRRLLHHFPEFPISLTDGPNIDSTLRRSWALSPQHNSRKNVYRLMPKAIRSISNTKVKCRSSFLVGFGELNVSRDRHADPLGESVHIATILRLGEKINIDRRTQVYRPKNLLSILSEIEVFYRTGQHSGQSPIEVVDWDSKLIARNTPQANVLLQTIVDARKRLAQ